MLNISLVGKITNFFIQILSNQDTIFYFIIGKLLTIISGVFPSLLVLFKKACRRYSKVTPQGIKKKSNPQLEAFTQQPDGIKDFARNMSGSSSKEKHHDHTAKFSSKIEKHSTLHDNIEDVPHAAEYEAPFDPYDDDTSMNDQSLRLEKKLKCLRQEMSDEIQNGIRHAIEQLADEISKMQSVATKHLEDVIKERIHELVSAEMSQNFVNHTA